MYQHPYIQGLRPPENCRPQDDPAWLLSTHYTLLCMWQDYMRRDGLEYSRSPRTS